MPSCPKCGKEAVSISGLTKHLTGTFTYGGHQMDRDAARTLAESAAALAPVPAPTPRASEPRAQQVALTPERERSFLDALFRSMAANKALPKYQFERRIDALLAVLLPDLLGQLLSTDVTFVVPEFPLKKSSSNQSSNVDHVYFDKRGRWLFVELKTDAASVSHDQIASYVEAARRGMPALMRDIHAIQAATTHRAKYGALLERLSDYPIAAPIELVYLAPTASRISRPSGMRVVTYRELATLQHRVYPEVWDMVSSTLIGAIE
jgi:hypothetical protein